MQPRLLFILLIVAFRPSARAQELPDNKFPAEVEQALNAPEKATLYSVEPDVLATAQDEKIYGRKLLGKTDLNPQQTATAVAEFRAAVAASKGARAMCFNPRHALRITFQKHDYLLLLCFECAGLRIYKDDKTLIADLGVAGSSEKLNLILTQAKIPLAAMETLEGQEAQRKREELYRQKWQQDQENAKVAEKRWLEGVPSSLRPFWTEYFTTYPQPDPVAQSRALSTEFPDAGQRAAALFRWYGSGEGPWSHYYLYETVAETLLLEIPTADLIRTAERKDLTEPQIEGAARLFSGPDFAQKRSDDLKMLSPALKKKLLEHSLKSADDDKRGRAQRAFGK